MLAKLELRNLLPGQAPEGVKCCGICGKPEARASAEVKALPHHAKAIAEDLPGKFRMLSKALGSGLMDFATKEKFNAQLEWTRDTLAAARAEHDALPVTATTKPKDSDKSKTVEALKKTLALLGVTVEGELSPLALSDKLHAEVSKLMGITAEVTAIVAEAPAAEPAPVDAPAEVAAIEQPEAPAEVGTTAHGGVYLL